MPLTFYVTHFLYVTTVMLWMIINADKFVALMLLVLPLSLYLFIISELCEEKTVALIYLLSENQSVNLVEMVKLFGCCDTLKERHL